MEKIATFEKSYCLSDIELIAGSKHDAIMKKTTIFPLLAVTAASAFGLGWMVHPASDGTSESDGESQIILKSGSRAGGAGIRNGGAAVSSPAQDFVSRYLVEGTISAGDMKAAIEELSKVNDPLLRQKMLAALLENLTQDNAMEAFLALRKNRAGGPFGRGGDHELRLLANAWGRIDGPSAIAALKEIVAEGGDRQRGGGRGGRGGDGDGEMMGALAGWATVDGAAAMAYLDTLEEGREKGMAGFGVIQGLLINGVDEAMSYVQSLSSDGNGGRAQEMYMGMIAGEILEQGEDAAKAWVDSVNDPSLKSGALTRVTMELMQNDRDATAEWLLDYANDDAASRAVGRLADSWAREDPEAVLEWAGQLAGDTKAEAYEEAMETWAREDPTAAGEYLTTLVASPEKDAATGAYAERVSREDPVAAMDWAQTIGDEEMRQETVVEVAQDWYRIDRAAAEAWIQSSGLSTEAVQQITDTNNRDGRGGGDRGGRGR